MADPISSADLIAEARKRWAVEHEALNKKPAPSYVFKWSSERLANALADALEQATRTPSELPENVCEAMGRLYVMGCHDGYCDLGGPATGQHTNGGYKCLSEIRNPQVRGWLRKLLRALHAASQSKDRGPERDRG